jgi:DeoR family fructose operon transcriptional repressor
MGVRVFLLGGEIKTVTEISFGEGTIRALAGFRFTKGFFGTNGISLTGGFSTPDPREAAVKAAALSACRQSYVLADESKFKAESNVRFARFEDATVITNRAPEGDLKNLHNLIIV